MTIDQQTPKLIAFYLTQFHPIPENDLWWGKGFTEWTNVTKAQPLFESHRQPHLPSDFGFYDLRLRETRRDQIALAKQYGLDGFCYHYYWFSGKRLLNIPLDDMLADPHSDMPFCLCWANENWTRRWDASEHEVLIEQKYLPEDDINFIKSLIPFFKDHRYIRVDKKPYLIVYRPQNFPDAKKTVEAWRNYCRSVGLGEIHLSAALTHGNNDYIDFGFDSGVEFPPHNFEANIINEEINFYKSFSGHLLQFSTIAKSFLDKTHKGSRIFKTVFPSWDNTARVKERALIVLNGVPENYEYWLASTIDLVKKQSNLDDQLIFINAWNEWAEGCHLEPDRSFGHGFLSATLNAKKGLRRFSTFPETGIPNTSKTTHENLSLLKDIQEVMKVHTHYRIAKFKLAIKRNQRAFQLLLPIVKSVRKLKRIWKGQ